MYRRTSQLLGFGLAYFVAAAAAVALTRFGGSVPVVWVASALLLARLMTSAVSEWRWFVVASFAGSVLATGFFGLGWAAAIPFALVNVGEAYLAAVICRWLQERVGQSKDTLTLFVLVACVASALVAALAGAIIAVSAGDSSFADDFSTWFVGRSLGMLTFAPIFVHYLRGDISKWFADVCRRRSVVDAVVLGAAAVAIAGSFLMSNYPLLFLPVLFLVVVTYRFGYVGPSLGIVLLTVIGSFLTINGHGPIMLVHGSPAAELQFLQFYLAASALTIFPIAASLSAKQRTTEMLSESEARFRIVADNVTDIVLSTDVDGLVTFISPSIRHYGNYSPDLIVGKSALMLIDPRFHEIVRDAHQRMLKARGQSIVFEYLGNTGGDGGRWFETNGRAICDGSGNPIGVVATVRETTLRKTLETELAIASQSDSLTGLPNRRAFFDSVRSHWAMSEAADNQGDCVAIVDLDHFKQINDRYGHAAGDEALRAFAMIGEATIRSTDVLARFGGEEFAILLPNTSVVQAQDICQRLLDNLARTEMCWDNGTFQVTASAGIARLDSGIAAALHNADTALYAAKNQGRARLALAA